MVIWRFLKDQALNIMLALLLAAWATIKLLSLKAAKQADVIRNYEVKEEADEVRDRPVSRDKHSILDRM